MIEDVVHDEWFELVKDIPWECFEAVADGNVRIKNIKFCMRVGSHMTRPTQALIVEGKFVRLKKWLNPHDYLLPLNANDPDKCLYQASHPFAPQPQKLWEPPTWMPQQAGMAQTAWTNPPLPMQYPLYQNAIGSGGAGAAGSVWVSTLGASTTSQASFPQYVGPQTLGSLGCASSTPVPKKSP